MYTSIIPGRRPPVAPDPDELIALITKRVMDYEVQNVVSIFREVYLKHYGFFINGFNKPAYITAIKKIIALCKYKRWDVRDFVECNIIWFLENSKYRPVPVNLCGPKAEMKYELFLRSHQYDGDVDSRTEELNSIRQTQERVAKMAAENALPDQVNKMAEEYARQQADSASIDLLKVKQSIPPFLARKMTDEQLLERGKQQVFFEAKAEYMRGWNFAHGQGADQTGQLQQV